MQPSRREAQATREGHAPVPLQTHPLPRYLTRTRTPHGVIAWIRLRAPLECSGEQAPTLNWPGKEIHRPNKSLKISVVPQLSLSPKASPSRVDQFGENLLIHGDCLDALMALRDHFEGKIRCVYLDPPFNTRLRFAQYRDILTHGQWLSMLHQCVTALTPLLAARPR